MGNSVPPIKIEIHPIVSCCFGKRTNGQDLLQSEKSPRVYGEHEGAKCRECKQPMVDDPTSIHTSQTSKKTRFQDESLQDECTK